MRMSSRSSSEVASSLRLVKTSTIPRLDRRGGARQARRQARQPAPLRRRRLLGRRRRRPPPRASGRAGRISPPAAAQTAISATGAFAISTSGVMSSTTGGRTPRRASPPARARPPAPLRPSRTIGATGRASAWLRLYRSRRHRAPRGARGRYSPCTAIKRRSAPSAARTAARRRSADRPGSAPAPPAPAPACR